MLSSTAECLYWLGRYMERAGNNARGLQVTLRMSSLTGAVDGLEHADALQPVDFPAGHGAQRRSGPTLTGVDVEIRQPDRLGL